MEYSNSFLFIQFGSSECLGAAVISFFIIGREREYQIYDDARVTEVCFFSEPIKCYAILDALIHGFFLPHASTSRIKHRILGIGSKD